MSIPRITGQQARELLDDFNNPRTFLGHVHTRPLLETLAWLYGQTGQDQWGDWELGHHDPYYQFAAVKPDGEGRISLAVGPYGQEILLDPDEAVEVARALLAAAEEVRP